MKTVIIVMLSALAITACTRVEDQKQKPSVPVESKTPDMSGVRVWKDPETGCEYLLLFNSSITPRYAHGGSSYEQQHVKGCSY